MSHEPDARTLGLSWHDEWSPLTYYRLFGLFRSFENRMEPLAGWCFVAEGRRGQGRVRHDTGNLGDCYILYIFHGPGTIREILPIMEKM